MNELRRRALYLLARRDHSRAELRKRLAPHAESETALDALLDELADRHLLSDARYAEMRVLARRSRYGNSRLAEELRQQGISAEDAGAALVAAGGELARAHAIWLRKFGTLPADAAERTRQTRFLLNRGFSGDTIRRLLRGEANELEEE